MKIHRSVLCATLVAAAACSSASATTRGIRSAGGDERNPGRRSSTPYEVWASDQSNTAPSQSSLGVKGSLLWIFDSHDIENQIATGEIAQPLPCYDLEEDQDAVGPCDLLRIFPSNLRQVFPTHLPNFSNLPQGQELADVSDKFGRLHGVITDPFNKYVVANIFTPGGGFVGVIKTDTKEAIALFRVTAFDATAVERSVHMSYWDDSDGSSILIDNLHGKAIEKILVTRDPETKEITSLEFELSSSLGLGKNMQVKEPASVFTGLNAQMNPMMGSVIGEYSEDRLGDVTPSGKCKENGCGNGIPDGELGGRPNNLPICPITSSNKNLYVTLAGGGMFVVDIPTMTIITEYGNNAVYGAGCGGVEVAGNRMYMNSGVSAGGAGKDWSMFAVWEFDDNAYDVANPTENVPMPIVVFEDEGNTATGGNLSGDATNESGQIIGMTTRRDSHGMDQVNDRYLHVVDRIQNVIEVFNVDNFSRTTYSLMTRRGQTGSDSLGVCEDFSVPGVPSNDPAPDLCEATPDGDYLMVAFRGPAPVSVNHSAQGSCPGVGVVEIKGNGRRGRLVTVLRTTNTVEDLIDEIPIPGGQTYTGNERSDVHGAVVVAKTW